MSDYLKILRAEHSVNQKARALRSMDRSNGPRHHQNVSDADDANSVATVTTVEPLTAEELRALPVAHQYSA